MRREAKNERYAKTKQRKKSIKWERKMNEGEGWHMGETRWREKKRDEDEAKSE